MIFPRAETPIQNYRRIRTNRKNPHKKNAPSSCHHSNTITIFTCGNCTLSVTNRYILNIQQSYCIITYIFYVQSLMSPLVRQQDPEWSLPPFNKGRWFCAAATNLLEDEMKKNMQWIFLYFYVHIYLFKIIQYMTMIYDIYLQIIDIFMSIYYSLRSFIGA